MIAVLTLYYIVLVTNTNPMSDRIYSFTGFCKQNQIVKCKVHNATRNIDLTPNIPLQSPLKNASRNNCDIDNTPPVQSYQCLLFSNN